MCGIAGILGPAADKARLRSMVDSQRHRGPDGEGIYAEPTGIATLGHNRLKIIDLSEAGRQPMTDASGRYHIVYNGEIYNYCELRRELNINFRSQTDTEVLLAAYLKWGVGCLDRLIGMFAFAIWDERKKELFAARDRFGVKPFYYHQQADGSLLFASEIKALHAAGLPRSPNPATWATYLAHGLSDTNQDTFWKGVCALPPGHSLRWSDGKLAIARWYDIAERAGDQLDERATEEIEEEYLGILKESVRLRFRSDVPVGINLSGGLDSSTLLGLVHTAQGTDSDVKAFTFWTGDAEYDELPWVRQMLDKTNHELIACRLEAQEVPSLAQSVQDAQDEPFGGIPTLAYARLFERARTERVTVLLDGNGMDEQWAGYDYYRNGNGNGSSLVQGTTEKSTRAECLLPEFRALATNGGTPKPFPDRLRNLQYRDVRYTKLPRALRFNDRSSMRSSTELREPFLDHRLVELALRQPSERKISNGTGKYLLRKIASGLVPSGVVHSPKRPLQTPQREWLRGPLREWSGMLIEKALAGYGGSWFDRKEVRQHWRDYCNGTGDNSFFIWQWVSIGLMFSNTEA